MYRAAAFNEGKMKVDLNDRPMLQGQKVLVVEDNKKDAANALMLLAKLGASSRTAFSIAEAKKALAEEAFDFLLIDIHLSRHKGHDIPDGLEVIMMALHAQPGIKIVANSSDANPELWKSVLKTGAHHIIRKPFLRQDEFENAFRLASDRKSASPTSFGVSQSPKGLWAKYANQYPEKVVIDPFTLKQARGLARQRLAPAVIYGETGTGKEVLAQLIHQFRCRNEGSNTPFAAVNCATIAGNLAESILFGHKKGSFTGAEDTTNGFIAEADGGILFLDEIHTLDMIVQQKLLRVLNDGTYNRLGEVKIQKSRFQLIAASTKDLDAEVEKGRFLLDLRCRMMGIDFRLKPLRERPEDIRPLVSLCLADKGVSLDDCALEKLCKKLSEFYWQGNIRQLFMAIDSWILQSEIDEVELDADHFPVFKTMLSPGGNQITENFNETVAKDVDLNEAVMRYEYAMLVNALKRHRTVTEAAKAMKTTRSTFDRRLTAHGLLEEKE